MDGSLEIQDAMPSRAHMPDHEMPIRVHVPEENRGTEREGEKSGFRRGAQTYKSADMYSGSEEGSYLRLIDLCITQLQARE